VAPDIFLGAIETKTSWRPFMSQSCNPCGFWNGSGLVVDLSNSRQTDVSVLLRHGTSNLESTRPAAGLSLAMNRAGR